MNRRPPSTLTPLFENWRRRIRGNERRSPVPFSNVVAEAAPVHEVDETEEALRPVHRAERTGQLERQDGVGPTERHDWAGPGERQGEDDPTVLRFPGEPLVALPPDS
ncbi:MAG: hypothetical protein V3W35_00660, partial [Gemmatimonadota bacterium]